MRDDRGQLIVISGFIIAIGLAVLTIMLNSAIYSGNTAYEGSMDMPNNDIQNLNQLTVRETNNAYYDANSSGHFDINKYNSYMDSFSSNVSLIYALKSESVQVARNQFNQNNKKSNPSVLFADVDNTYQHQSSFIISPNVMTPDYKQTNIPSPGTGSPVAIGLIVTDGWNGYQANVSKTGSISIEAILINQSGYLIQAPGTEIHISATYGSISPATVLATSTVGASFSISDPSNIAGVSTITVTSPGLMPATLHVKFY